MNTTSNNQPLLNALVMVVVSVLFFTSTVLAGGPWTLKKKSGFVQGQVTLPAYRYSALLMGTAIKDVQPINRRVFNSDFGIYAEYGLTDKIDIMTQLPFKYVDTGEQTDSLYFPTLLDEGSLIGMSNYRLGVKYGILDKNLKGAISVQTMWNTVSTDLNKGLATGFGASAFGLFGHVGGSINSKWYAFGELGYMKYNNNFSDALEGRVEVGRNLGSSFLLMLTTGIRKSLDNGSYFNENLAQTGLYPNNQEWIASSLKLNYESERGIGASVGTALIPIKFRYVGFNGAFEFGIYKKW